MSCNLHPSNAVCHHRLTGLLYILPFITIHAIDTLKASLGLAGRLRRLLQAALMRKFLTFREDIRDTISTGDMSMAMTRDISEVVECGYMKLIKLICVVGKLCYAMIFILHENHLAAVPLGAFLVFGCIFLLLREPKMIKSTEDMARKQNNMVHVVHDVIANYKLIRDFNLRPFIVSRYEERIKDFNWRSTDTSVIMQNNAYLPPWLTTLLVGGYMIYGTFQVKALGGHLSLGAYFATLSVFKEVGNEMSEIYFEVMEVLKVTGPLRTITFFMNQPTFLHQHLQRNRKRRLLGKERRLAARRGQESGANGVATTDAGKVIFAVDTLKVELKNVAFRYGTTPMLNGVSRDFGQGRLYAFVGPEHQGKATLLRILGGVLLPEDGDVFVPVHLRVLHVGREGLFLNETFLSNLIFNWQLEALGGFDRVRRICSRCGFSAAVLRLLDDTAKEAETNGKDPAKEAAKDAWAKRFTSTDFARLNLARALVMNPECLVMHMPLITFSDEQAKKTLELLRAHIDERGLELPEEGKKFRRPRTVFFSSSALDRCTLADEVFEVSRGHGLRPVPRASEVRGLTR